VVYTAHTVSTWSRVSMDKQLFPIQNCVCNACVCLCRTLFIVGLYAIRLSNANLCKHIYTCKPTGIDRDLLGPIHALISLLRTQKLYFLTPSQNAPHTFCGPFPSCVGLLIWGGPFLARRDDPPSRDLCEPFVARLAAEPASPLFIILIHQLAVCDLIMTRD